MKPKRPLRRRRKVHRRKKIREKHQEYMNQLQRPFKQITYEDISVEEEPDPSEVLTLDDVPENGKDANTNGYHKVVNEVRVGTNHDSPPEQDYDALVDEVTERHEYPTVTESMYDKQPWRPFNPKFQRPLEFDEPRIRAKQYRTTARPKPTTTIEPYYQYDDGFLDEFLVEFDDGFDDTNIVIDPNPKPLPAPSPQPRPPPQHPLHQQYRGNYPNSPVPNILQYPDDYDTSDDYVDYDDPQTDVTGDDDYQERQPQQPQQQLQGQVYPSPVPELYHGLPPFPASHYGHRQRYGPVHSPFARPNPYYPQSVPSGAPIQNIQPQQGYDDGSNNAPSYGPSYNVHQQPPPAGFNPAGTNDDYYDYDSGEEDSQQVLRPQVEQAREALTSHRGRRRPHRDQEEEDDEERAQMHRYFTNDAHGRGEEEQESDQNSHLVPASEYVEYTDSPDYEGKDYDGREEEEGQQGRYRDYEDYDRRRPSDEEEEEEEEEDGEYNSDRRRPPPRPSSSDYDYDEGEEEREFNRDERSAYTDDNRWDDYFDNHRKGIDDSIHGLVDNREDFQEPEGQQQQDDGGDDERRYRDEEEEDSRGKRHRQDGDYPEDEEGISEEDYDERQESRPPPPPPRMARRRYRRPRHHLRMQPAEEVRNALQYGQGQPAYGGGDDYEDDKEGDYQDPDMPGRKGEPPEVHQPPPPAQHLRQPPQQQHRQYQPAPSPPPQVPLPLPSPPHTAHHPHHFVRPPKIPPNSQHTFATTPIGSRILFPPPPRNDDIPGFDDFFSRIEKRFEDEVGPDDERDEPEEREWKMPTYDGEEMDRGPDGDRDNSGDLRPNHYRDFAPDHLDFQMPSHEELQENYKTHVTSN